VAQQMVATHFAAEHKIFLKAALALLMERDKHAPTVGMMDPVVLKAGPLKKASHLMNGVWKVKYVEIRRGMFSYYENAVSKADNRKSGGRGGNGNGGNSNTPGGQLRRKNIPLDAGLVYSGGSGGNSGGAAGGNNTGGGGATGLGGGYNNSDLIAAAGGGGNSTNSGNHDHHAPCTCRAVRLHQKAFLKLTTPGQAGAMFELSVHGQKRLWMANSRAERAVWMQAIENAMVGGSVTGYNSTGSAGGDVFDHRGKIRHVSPRSPFRSDLRLYLRLQSYLRSIHTKTEYVDGLREVLNHPIKVPVKWIAKQALLSDQAEGNNAFLEQEVDLSVEQLWRDLQRDSVCIDGKVYRGDHPTQGPERILGALMRRILQTAAASPTTTRTDWTQAQALSFARDILLSGNRTRSGGDSYFCINSLFKHPELVVVVPSGTEVEPVAIVVSQDESDLQLNAKSGWIQTRSSKLQRSWKKFFFVLSEGMLTHYERAAPRPHGLRGQLAMTDASISVTRRQRPNSSSATDTYFVISIFAKDGKERLLRFENENRILDWTHALETMARAKGPNSKCATISAANASEPAVTAPSSISSTTASAARRLMPRRRTGGSSQDDANQNTNISASAALTAAAPTTPGTATSSLAEQVMEVHGRNLGISMDKVKERLALRSRKTSSAVRVFIQAVTDYKICTTDPDGDEQLDTWGYVRTQFQQSFRLSGGPSGFISRGEEIVLVTVMDCVDLGVVQGGEDAQQTLQQHQQQQSAIPLSPDDIPPSPARRQLRKTRIFRQFLDDPGAEDP
jgi:PH domain